LHLNNILTHCLVGDLDSSKGQINSFGDKPGGLKMVDSLVPLAERDVGTLRGMTKACASYIGQLPTPPSTYIRPCMSLLQLFPATLLHLNNILTHCLVGDLDSSKGQINSFGDKPGGLKMVDSLVPLAERDVGTLRGMTKACASYIG
ncbi:hypothetical protein HID58_032692, partial [Brassica napus]